MVHYLAIDGTKTDALTRFQVLEMIESGEVKKSTLAWAQGMETWRPLGELKEFENAFDHLAPGEESGGGFDPVPNLAGGDSEQKAETPFPQRTPRKVAGTADSKPLPWMRLFARGVDLILFILVFEGIFALVIPDIGIAIGQSYTAQMIANSLMILVWCFIEALLLSTWGTTPGKSLFRVVVRTSDGGIPSYKIALQRSVLVWVKGLALMVVWVTPIAMMIAHARLMVFGTTSWDRDLRIRVTHGRPGQIQFAVAIAIYAAFAYLLYAAVQHHLENMPRENPREEEGQPGEEDGDVEKPKTSPNHPEDLAYFQDQEPRDSYISKIICCRD